MDAFEKVTKTLEAAVDQSCGVWGRLLVSRDERILPSDLAKIEGSEAGQKLVTTAHSRLGEWIDSTGTRIGSHLFHIPGFYVLEVNLEPGFIGTPVVNFAALGIGADGFKVLFCKDTYDNRSHAQYREYEPTVSNLTLFGLKTTPDELMKLCEQIAERI